MTCLMDCCHRYVLNSFIFVSFINFCVNLTILRCKYIPIIVELFSTSHTVLLPMEIMSKWKETIILNSQIILALQRPGRPWLWMVLQWLMRPTWLQTLLQIAVPFCSGRRYTGKRQQMRGDYMHGWADGTIFYIQTSYFWSVEIM